MIAESTACRDVGEFRKSSNPGAPALPHYLFAWAVGGNYDSQELRKSWLAGRMRLLIDASRVHTFA